ncbi:MAG: hypothetical protein M3Y86_04500 [Verrucomicrobiota bacterium]|nr:hypothetical protein [Verrucomicrobiota bacterium]
MKASLIFIAIAIALAITSCTTLENRRDLYRSPMEGYEPWYPQPPPTRLPSTAPGTSATSAAAQSHGVITFPEEPLPDAGH